MSASPSTALSCKILHNSLLIQATRTSSTSRWAWMKMMHCCSMPFSSHWLKLALNRIKWTFGKHCRLTTARQEGKGESASCHCPLSQQTETDRETISAFSIVLQLIYRVVLFRFQLYHSSLQTAIAIRSRAILNFSDQTFVYTVLWLSIMSCLSFFPKLHLPYFNVT